MEPGHKATESDPVGEQGQKEPGHRRRRYVRLRHRRQRRGGLCSVPPSDRGPGRHRLRSGMRPARPASVHSYPRRLHQDVVQPELYLAIPHRAGRVHRQPPHSHHARPHPGRLQLHQRHDLQPRPTRRLRPLGATRQPAAGVMSMCYRISNAPSGASASATIASTDARAVCPLPTWTGFIRFATRSWRALRNWACRDARITIREIVRPALDISND